MKLKALLLALTLFILGGHNAYAESFQEGVHYEVISESSDADDKGVTEFFSFYCVHCYRFEVIADLLDKEFGDSFSKVHMPSVAPGPDAGIEMTKAFVLAKKLGVEDKISSALFSYNFDKKMMLTTREDIRSVFILNGVTGDQYDSGIDSFSIKATMNQWERQTDKYKVRATPTFIVNGKYKMDPMSLKESEDFAQSFVALTKYLLNK
ncbi:Thiol:disulfide interchange protein DsbA [Pseudidiomarina planktonica]|uniref:Thiol:disulfide interchange protein n=1 Tax=Pseudidiomarina planktonica TaxID=1323738 RepID=A0A1Y6EAM3_9GAMM|nr:thiol:disulfide interchange protein DsbA/DsbL [Pseudidiomarina planktonica]RUO66450.1 thiol:disulfide interchange protein DsbA/DsbL [Pseudidiomarina planktonica]SMQ57970.1 Thiol:disulfide interchange protein DsbA [Pseudidiomarina planktonica]